MTTQQKIQDLFDNFFNFLVEDSEFKGHATTEEKRILCQNFSNFLQEKNKRYGDAALKPIQIFSKSDASTQISNRLDDKLSRIKTFTLLVKNDLSDVFGYISLLLIQKDWIYFRTIKEKQTTKVETSNFEIFTNENNKLINKINNQLSIIKSSTELKGSDVHKLFELISISLIENNWIEFSELID